MKTEPIKKHLTWALLTMALMGLPSMSMAAEYYISPTGNDTTGTGAIGNPYRTIQHVLDSVAGAGDTLTLRSGTYQEAIEIGRPNLTIRSMTGEWAVIQCPIDDPDKGVAVAFDVDPEHSDGSRLERVEVIGGYWYGIKFETKWDWGGTDRSGASNITITGCKIHDTGESCIKVTPESDDITIQQCEIYNSGRNDPDSAEGIDNVNGDRMLVQGCYIHDVTGTGMYAKGGPTGVKFERCLIKNCGSAGILVGFDTSPEWFDTDTNPDYYENIDGEVTNCVVVNTQYSGIGLYAAKNPKIYNNTLVDVAKAGHSGLYFGLTFQDWDPEAGRPPSLNPVLRNNIVVQSAADNTTAMEIRWDDELGGMSALSGSPTMSNNRYYIQGGTAGFVDERPGSEFSGGLAAWKSHISGDTGTTEGDPGFVDQVGGDYHLSATSPCIDSGTSTGAPLTDYDGNTRPQGSGYDIGAYEYTTTANPIPEIQANGSNTSITVSTGDTLSVTISLDPGSHRDEAADWWILASNAADWFHYDVIGGTWSWRAGLSVAYQGPLFDLTRFEVLKAPQDLTLPPGDYTFYFGVDMSINGSVDFDQLYYDTVSVAVTPTTGSGQVNPPEEEVAAGY
ncbi:MAG: right-handed parallel beta-helix repeat-containing protein [Deltaproteobacteria bacterium]|nr:right-handed parallel beta-helix repeat-containing protein [Deltaproteobacteria bacterium]